MTVLLAPFHLFFQHSSIIPFPTLSTDGQGKNWGLGEVPFPWQPQLEAATSKRVRAQVSFTEAGGLLADL